MNPDEAMAFLAAYLGVIIGVSVCVIIVWLAVAIPFCMSMSKALNQVSESNRQMQPGLVWLFLVPCLNIIWLFFIVIQIPASLQKEFQDRGKDDGSSYGKGMGLTAAILWAVEFVMGCIPFLNYCAPLVGLVGIVFGIIFWVQVAGYAGKLAGGGKGKSSRDDDE